MMKVKMIEKRQNGVCLFELQNDEIKVITSNLGCHILSVFTKDRDGNYGDVVLGYQDVEDCHKDDKFLGCIIGRVANRIANGEFQLNGKTYKLVVNSGPNTIHGGINGFNQKIFNYEILEDGIRFIYLSPDMEEGFPGSLYLKIVYRLSGNELKMEYEAMSDQDTLINIANHSFFNLSAKDSKIYDHQLMIKSDQIACADENGLPTGKFLDVENTPFDFKSFLKTPLTSIIAYLSLLNESPDMSEEQRAKYIGISLEKAKRLGELINEFFEITRYNLQNITLDKKEFYLYVLLEQVMDSFAAVFKQKGLEWKIEVDDKILIYGDPDRLARVFENLLRNAVSYCYPNSLIEVYGMIDGDNAEILVRNQGKTIPEHQLNNLFEKFYRLDEARSSETGGAGLGLAIAKEIIELHDGTIKAKSQNEYTTFIIRLPRKKEEQ